jgi:hypothetical protein
MMPRVSEPVPSARRKLLIAGGVAAGLSLVGLLVWMGRSEPQPHAKGQAAGSGQARGGQAPAGFSVDVSVLDDYQRPVADAVVEAFAPSAPERAAAAASTDAKGLATLVRLPEGRYELRARKAGYSDEALADVRAGPGPRELQSLTLARASQLRGRVIGADGRAAARASVVLRGSGALEPPSAKTSADGSFALIDLPAGVYGAQASLGALVSKTEEGIALAAGAEAFVELQLEAAAVLAGQVTDRATGKPLAAEVTVEGGAPGQNDRFSAEGGRFETLAPAGATLRVFFEEPGYMPRSELGIAGGPGLVVALDRAATLKGIVRDAQGAPVSNAEIEVVGEGLGLEGTGGMAIGLNIAPGESLGVSIGPVPKIPLDGASSPVALLGGSSGGAGSGWKTGADGRFAITPVAPGALHVVARHAVLTPGRSASLEAKPGAVVEGLEIELAAGGIVLGEVVDDADQAVAGVPVELVLDRELSRRMTASDRDGRFAIGPVRGSGHVIAHPPGAPAVQVALSVEAGDEVPIVLRINRASAAVRGEVVGSAGEPIVAAVVRISVASAEPPVSRTAITDSLGLFEIAGLPEEACRLEIEHPDHAPLVLEVVPGGPPLQLELAEGGSLEAELRDAQAGDLVRGAIVSLRDARGAVAGKARSNASGKIEIRSISAGIYTLIIEHKSYGTTRIPATLEESDSRLDLGVIELAAVGSALGQVVDQYGATVAKAEVTFGAPPDWRRAVRTDAKGNFQLSGLGAGELALTARAGGSESDPVDVRIDSGTQTDGVVLRIAGAIDLPEAELEPETRVAQTETPATAEDVPKPSPRLTEGIALQVAYALGSVRVEAVLGVAARQAGLQVGDVLTRIDGETILAASQARALMRGRAGSTVAIELQRGGQRVRLKVVRERF